MPEISRFFGIVIRMYFSEHQPSHFHAEYGEYIAEINIDTLEVIAGKLPRRAMALTLEWAVLHRDELRQNWQLARVEEPLRRIAPLE